MVCSRQSDLHRLKCAWTLVQALSKTFVKNMCHTIEWDVSHRLQVWSCSQSHQSSSDLHERCFTWCLSYCRSLSRCACLRLSWKLSIRYEPLCVGQWSSSLGSETEARPLQLFTVQLSKPALEGAATDCSTRTARTSDTCQALNPGAPSVLPVHCLSTGIRMRGCSGLAIHLSLT